MIRKWLILKWFWFVRNSAAAARQGWEAAGSQVSSIKSGAGLKL